MRALALAALLLLVVVVPSSASAAATDGGADPGFPSSRLALEISGPLRADETLVIRATGTNAARLDSTDELSVPYFLELIVTDPEILPGDCATTESAELSRIATVRDGGSLLTYAGLPEGSFGSFSLREPYEPVGSGPLQVCAYSESDHADAAWAQADVRVAAAPSPPRALARPVVHRAGRSLTCTRGRWTQDPGRFRFRWRLGDGRLGPARTGARLEPSRHDVGRLARCEVIATGAGGTGTATSAAVRIR